MKQINVKRLLLPNLPYDTTGASHVGIYVGNNMMLHCGDPIQYTSLNSSYWQSHFLAYGRVPAP